MQTLGAGDGVTAGSMCPSATDWMSFGGEYANGGFEIRLLNHQVVSRRAGDPVDADMLARERSGKRCHHTEYRRRVKADLKGTPSAVAIDSLRHNVVGSDDRQCRLRSSDRDRSSGQRPVWNLCAFLQRANGEFSLQ